MPVLDRVLWFFFRNCPLVEQGEEDAGEANDEERASRPRLPVSTFSPLLCTLLLNQNAQIAEATQFALTQFIVRLHSPSSALAVQPTRQALPGEEPIVFPDDDAELIRSVEGREGEPVPHEHYAFSAKERAAVQEEIFENVAFAIGKLNPEERLQQQKEAKELEAQEKANGDAADKADGWDSQPIEAWHAPASTQGDLDSELMSGYEADVDTEAAVGRMASISLLAAFAAERIVPAEDLERRFIPELLRLRADSAFFVRKEVALLVAALSKCVSARCVEEELLATFEMLLTDKIWHVRQAACLSMPGLFGAIKDPALRREKVTSAVRLFAEDVSRDVRSAVLEIIGELIYLFHEDPEGPPPHLVRFFKGDPYDGTEQPKNETSIDLGEDSQAMDGMWDTSAWGDTSTDLERPLVVAFNMPAVVLTLGRDRWPELREMHAELTQNNSAKVRRSLAASLHEIAKIIGPEAARADLLPVFDRFFLSQESEVRAAAIDHFDELVVCLPADDAQGKLQLVKDHWTVLFSRDWRLRERIAQLIEPLAKQLLVGDEDGNLVALMQLALSDPVASVRAAGTKSVPALYSIFNEHDQVIADGFLGMISDLGGEEKFRMRLSCLLAIQALVEWRIQRSSFELVLLERLLKLGEDRVVDVRILLARVVALMCSMGEYQAIWNKGAAADILSLTDELYASPQSRSSELNGLIERLACDRNEQVRQIIAEVLPDGQEMQPRRTPSPELRRELQLGPAEGGPHKPESSERDYDFADEGGVVQMQMQMPDEDDLEAQAQAQAEGGWTAHAREEVEDDEEEEERGTGSGEHDEEDEEMGMSNGSSSGDKEDWVFGHDEEDDSGEAHMPAESTASDGATPSNKSPSTLYSPMKHASTAASRSDESTGDDEDVDGRMDMSPVKKAAVAPAPASASRSSSSDPFLAFVAHQRDRRDGDGGQYDDEDDGDDAHAAVKLALDDAMEED